MSKIIQIATAINGKHASRTYGDSYSHVLYALTDDGRIFWQRTDDNVWEEQRLPALSISGGQDG